MKMALNTNLPSLLRRMVLTDLRSSFRLSSGQVDGAEGEEPEAVDPTKDRTKIIPLETSLRYLNSKAYRQTYGDSPVWFLYRRNHKGGVAPKKTRRSCVRNGVISTGNPCPICRDEYLVLDHRTLNYYSSLYRNILVRSWILSILVFVTRTIFLHPMVAWKKFLISNKAAKMYTFSICTSVIIVILFAIKYIVLYFYEGSILSY